MKKVPFCEGTFFVRDDTATPTPDTGSRPF